MKRPLAPLAQALLGLGLTPRVDPTGSRLTVAPEIPLPGLSRPLTLPLLETEAGAEGLILPFPVPLEPPLPPDLLEDWAKAPRLLGLGLVGERAYLQVRLPLAALNQESAPALLEAAFRDLEALQLLLERREDHLPRA